MGSLELPDFLREEYPLLWQMTRAERVAFVQLLDYVRPPVAVEVGTLRGGSLQVIAARAGKVYSIDNNPDVAEALRGRFPNVTFRTGDSTAVLPAVLTEIESRGEELGFVLIDGDHTGPGVRADINAILRYTPCRPVYVLLHDSFNPSCRAGMLAADWHACPYAQHVEIDYVAGTFQPNLPAPDLVMWAGFGLALLGPPQRTEPLVIRQALKDMFEQLYSLSSHAPSPLVLPEMHDVAAPRLSSWHPGRLVRGLARRLRRWAGLRKGKQRS